MAKRGKIKRGHVEGAKAAMLLSEPEIAVERARFIGSFDYEPPRTTEGRYGEREHLIEDRALLYLLIAARGLRTAATIDEWREYASSYPTAPLEDREKRTRKNNPQRSVRLHFAFEAILRLLELEKAPQELREEFEILSEKIRPRVADLRARAQEEILKNPKQTMRQIASLSGYSASEICRDLDRGYLLWPV